LGSNGGWVRRLIETNLASAGKTKRGLAFPIRGLNWRALDLLRGETFDLALQVVAHEVDHGSHERAAAMRLVAGFVFFDRMDSSLGVRRGEGEPACADVNGTEGEDITEEGAVGFRGSRYRTDLSAGDHGRSVAGRRLQQELPHLLFPRDSRIIPASRK